jgi:hypothetical protein
MEVACNNIEDSIVVGPILKRLDKVNGPLPDNYTNIHNVIQEYERLLANPQEMEALTQKRAKEYLLTKLILFMIVSMRLKIVVKLFMIVSMRLKKRGI